MADNQPIFVADQENTSASATTILAVPTVIFFLLCFFEYDLLAKDRPIVAAD